jgi:hypothetical protein
MVVEMRRRVLRPLIWVGAVPLVLALIVIAMALAAAGGLSKVDPFGWRILAGVVVVAGTIAVAAFGTRWWVQRQLNPNRDYPMRPRPYPGAPEAWKLDGTTGASVAPPAVEAVSNVESTTLRYERQRPEMLAGGWVVVQLAKVTFPRICCSCLAPTEGVYRFGFHDVVKTPLRLCPACSRREGRRWALWFWGGFVVVWLLVAWATLTSKRMTAIDVAKALLLFGPIVGGLFGIATAAIGSRVFAGALSVRRFAADLNTVQMRFRNRGYTDLFLDAQRGAPAPRAPRLSA